MDKSLNRGKGQIVTRLLDWFDDNARELPWRKTRDPYAIWVSEIMLQQTQVKTVLGYWDRWLRALPAVQSLARAKSERLHKLWEGLGYYTRVRNMQKAAKVIVESHQGLFPQRFEEVLALPGIGRYTAGAICSIAFEQPRAVLDGNVIRVLTRLYAVTGEPREKKTNDQLWGMAQALVDEASRMAGRKSRPCSRLNQALMELGAVVCTPAKPGCFVCPVARHCVARRNGLVTRLPRASGRARATHRRFVAFVAEKRGRFLVRQRPEGVVNAHLWEFPNVELVRGNGDATHAARAELGAEMSETEPFVRIKHSITRYRITLEAFRVTGGEGGRGQWFSRRQLMRLPFASAHKKVLNELG